MSGRLPTTKQLQYFAALARHQHFGKAAEACFVSQPAFSVAIRELESCLNVQLVDRDNKNVVITAVGQLIAEQARRVLIEMQGLQEIASYSQGEMRGQLSLGVIPTVAPFLLPRVLPRLRRAFPGLQLLLHEAMSEELYQQLLEGRLDLLLLALPYDMRGMETLPLFRDPFHLAFHRDTDLLDPEEHQVDKLPDASILLLRDGHCLRGHSLSACKISNQAKLSPIQASSLLTLVQMIEADLGVSYLPEMALGSYLLANTAIATRPMSEESYREIGLAWRKGSRREGDFKVLGEFFREHRHAAGPGPERE